MQVFGRWEESGIPGGNTRNTRRTPPTEQVLFYRQKTTEGCEEAHRKTSRVMGHFIYRKVQKRRGTTDPWRVEDPSDWKDWQLGSLRSSRWETKQEKSVKMMYLKTIFDRETERQRNVLPVSCFVMWNTNLCGSILSHRQTQKPGSSSFSHSGILWVGWALQSCSSTEAHDQYYNTILPSTGERPGWQKDVWKSLNRLILLSSFKLFNSSRPLGVCVHKFILITFQP